MSVEFKDYYKILDVPRDASPEDIKKAFRKMARKHHPDVAKDKKGAEEKFKEINEANEVLGDPEKRRQYDQLGAEWQNGGRAPQSGRRGRGGNGTAHEFNFGGTGFSDFFEQYFSGGGRHDFTEEAHAGFRGSAGFRKRRGGDIEGDILVTLIEAMHGAVRPITLEMSHPKTGQLEKHSFQVRIPAGVKHGSRIRISGQGEPGAGGGESGDLYLRVRHASHPDFHTEGADLYHELELAPWEAVLGAEISVPTLDGPVRLRVPAGSENNQHLRVKGRGLPSGKSGDRGDFYAVIKIVLPVTPNDEERSLWEKLRSTSHFKPRENPLRD